MSAEKRKSHAAFIRHLYESQYNTDGTKFRFVFSFIQCVWTKQMRNSCVLVLLEFVIFVVLRKNEFSITTLARFDEIMDVDVLGCVSE